DRHGKRISWGRIQLTPIGCAVQTGVRSHCGVARAACPRPRRALQHPPSLSFAHILIGEPASTSPGYAPGSKTSMLDAAAKALAQMFTPPFRTVLLKSVGLAIALLAVLGIALYRLLEWLTGAGETWAEGTLGPLSHTPLAVLGWILAFALGFGLFAGAIVLMPAVPP